MFSGNLFNSLGDAIISSVDAIVICDKYPKAKHHYLVCPKKYLPSIFDLKREHITLLDDMHLLALNVIELKGISSDYFKIGFHAKPSMQHLHLHVISKDFISSCLKTKKHWNSFNTELFIPFEHVRGAIETKGTIHRMEADELKKLISADLRCNQCTFIAKNMPTLKDHLLTHE